MKKIFILSFSFLMGVLLFSACSSKPKPLDRPAFCADSAYTYIEKQMSFGPRVPNSKGHNDCAVWLIQKLRSFGAEVELQRGQMPDYRGNMQQIYNIIAHFTPSSSPRILLGAHYDTRPWCDEEENYSDRYYNVPGANDGASGVGVLLEVARQIGLIPVRSVKTHGASVRNFGLPIMPKCQMINLKYQIHNTALVLC